MKLEGKRPNILLIMTDEERFPPVYEDAFYQDFLRKNLAGRQAIRKNSVQFNRHYAASTACCPSRASLFTGQYPSLHGVTQTTGLAKSSQDPGTFWLDPDTVPTLGDYFRQGGYRTFWKGKWHIADLDLIVPGTNTPIDSNTVEGPMPEKIKLYENANRMREYGFDGWIGPEPHGANPANCGTVRDPGFACQAADLIADLDKDSRKDPWLMVCSFVNPHDIVFYGLAWQKWMHDYGFQNSGPVTDGLTFPKPPTLEEALQSKPRVQYDYVTRYGWMYMRQPAELEAYQRFYYYLQAEVDQHIHKVYQALQSSRFYENTIVVFTSDHGDMMGAHGGMHQKWYNAYEETLHVPLIFSNPVAFEGETVVESLSSHVDLLPTLCDLADIDMAAARERLAETHTEAQMPVGNSLADVIEGGKESPDKAVYFMTDDEISEGEDMVNIRGHAYGSIIEPCHLETVIAKLPSQGGDLWKYTRYFDNIRFTWGPGNQDPAPDEPFMPDEYELYNVSADPTEVTNLASPVVDQNPPEGVRETMEKLLKTQRSKKRILPRNHNPIDIPRS